MGSRLCSSPGVTPRNMHLLVLLVATILLLPQADSGINSKDIETLDLHTIRGSSVCAVLVSNSDTSSKSDPYGKPDPRPLFGNARQLPLSECRRPLDLAYVDEGRYWLLSNLSDVVASLARNYTYTFCINAVYNTVRFSCYRVRGIEGETYFVAPTDYERVLVRGPVGFYKCPQVFEGLLIPYWPLVQDEQVCTTFLTVSSYGVRTDSGECMRLSRYALFSHYPEVWNGCQRYAEGDSGNVFYDCHFDSDSEPWNYPTQEEVAHCAERLHRIECSSVSDAEADASYFYAGRDKGDMTQNKFDMERCHRRSFGASGSWYSPSDTSFDYYPRKLAIGGGVIGAVVVFIAARLVYLLLRSVIGGSKPAQSETAGRANAPYTSL